MEVLPASDRAEQKECDSLEVELDSVAHESGRLTTNKQCEVMIELYHQGNERRVNASE